MIPSSAHVPMPAESRNNTESSICAKCNVVGTGLALFLACTLVAACSGGESGPESRNIHELDVQLREVLLLGEDDSASPEYLFGSPKFVVTDGQGHIYVADESVMNIRVYDATGQYIRTLGQRGQAPMEFRSFRGLTINPENEIIALDRINSRISRFTTEGQLLSTRPWRRWATTQIRSFRNGYLFLNNQTEGVGDLDHLFQSYGPSLEKDSLAFGSTDEIIDPHDRIESSMLSSSPGSFVVTGDGVLYAPSLYGGMLYMYTDEKGQWYQTRQLSGLVEKRAYTKVDRPVIYENVDILVHYSGTKEGAQLHNTSLGLFRLQNHQIVHFTFCEFGRERLFGLELRDEDGQLTGYGAIESVPLTSQGIASLFLDIVWKDDQDRFYIIDRRVRPVIRVVELEYRSVTTESKGLGT